MSGERHDQSKQTQRDAGVHDSCMLTSVSTLCLKKSSTFKLSVTLSNLNQFCKIFALLESLWNLLQNTHRTISTSP